MTSPTPDPDPKPVTVRGRTLGGERLFFIAGPCVLESRQLTYDIAGRLREIFVERDVNFVFKASFDKANRSSLGGGRGAGMEAGLGWLSAVREDLDIPVLTDVHLPDQCAAAAEAVDVLQIPAFLCRQTDLVVAAARTGRTVNIKKGQFLAPEDTQHIVAKVHSTGNQNIMLTERGSSYGYHNLVVDFRSLQRMASLNVPVCFDSTHSVQLPGAADGRSDGEREFIPLLARAAVAVGVDALFFEVHDDPQRALCDGPNQIPLAEFPAVLESLPTV